MGRWDFDDERSTGSGSAEGDGVRAARRRGTTTGRAFTRCLSAARFVLGIGTTRSREHALALPSGPSREPVRDEARLYHLRGSEVELLERAGRYRAVFTDDLQADAKDVTRARTDVASLERQGLIETRTVTRLRDGAVADVVSVTHAGKALLDHHRDPARDRGTGVPRGLGEAGGGLA